MVSTPRNVIPNGYGQFLTVEEGPGKRLTVEEQFLDIFGQLVPVPDAEMIIFVSAKEEPFEL